MFDQLLLSMVVIAACCGAITLGSITVIVMLIEIYHDDDGSEGVSLKSEARKAAATAPGQCQSTHR